MSVTTLLSKRSLDLLKGAEKRLGGGDVPGGEGKPTGGKELEVAGGHRVAEDSISHSLWAEGGLQQQ